VKLHTKFGKVKLALKGHNEAKITIEAMVRKQAWLVSHEEKKPEKSLYGGVFNKIRQEN
jgi:hypothetical protein